VCSEEKYEFDVSLHLEPESLLPRSVAPLIILAALTIHDAPAPLTLLQDVSLTITAMDADDATSVQEVSGGPQCPGCGAEHTRGHQGDPACMRGSTSVQEWRGAL
jgi:hypothetical protein